MFAACVKNIPILLDELWVEWCCIPGSRSWAWWPFRPLTNRDLHILYSTFLGDTPLIVPQQRYFLMLAWGSELPSFGPSDLVAGFADEGFRVRSSCTRFHNRTRSSVSANVVFVISAVFTAVREPLESFRCPHNIHRSQHFLKNWWVGDWWL